MCLACERLLDHHQAVSIQLLEHGRVYNRVGGVSINHQWQVRESRAYRGHRLNVPARLNFYFDAPVALCREPLHPFKQLCNLIVNADGNTRWNGTDSGPKQFAEGQPEGLSVSVP